MYLKYSDYLKNKYHAKTYKLPVDINATCPNRDGTLGVGGCTYCGECGAGFETLPSSFLVDEQLRANMLYIGKKYKANKFIAFFQNFTNTYMPVEQFKRYMKQACIDGIVELCISTRPDCVSTSYLEVLQSIKESYNVNISIELGLQSSNHKTLAKLNRGHTLAEFIDAVICIKKFGFDVCSHIIANLPWDELSDVIECSKIISALGVDQIKLHALYIQKDTAMYEQYKNGEFAICSVEEYIERVISFLEYLAPHIAVQRLIGRAPKYESAFTNWDMSWRKIQNTIEAEMLLRNTYQGIKFNYTGGKAVRSFT